MASPELRLVVPVPGDAANTSESDLRRGRLGALLVDAGKLSQAALEDALARQVHLPARLGDILLSEGLVRPDDLCDALARQSGTVALDPAHYRPDLDLVDRLDPTFCAVNEVLPLRRIGAASLVVTARPERFAALRPHIEARIGPVLVATALPSQLRSALLSVRRRHLVHRAETRAEARFSCRSLRAGHIARAFLIVVALGLCGVLLAPTLLFTVVTVLSFLVLTANSALGVAAAVIFRNARRPPDAAAPSENRIATLPVRPVPVSLLVPLFRERQIAARLIERLSRLDYPRAQLEVLLIVEADDRTTQDTLSATDLPGWMRVIEVPRGTIQTKPRALNYALDFCTGTIVGIYDAEDEPDPQQIRRVVEHFHHSPPDVACLQGQLDFYNAHQNWIARCFTIDYAVWFRLILPALAHLGLVVPLGGTTVFLRRTALVQLGGWDAHNVTEDADLGVRLARRGFRTELLQSVTLEEANCRAWPWIRQRSRWLKGYGLTWLVHMRNPRVLWRDLGARRFWGVQLLFLGSLGGALLAPVLWTFLLMTLGLPHPWSGAMTPLYGWLLTLFLGASMLIQWGLGWLALNDRGRPGLERSVPLLTVYHVMATIAVLKGAFEMLICPFYWDKTSHGEEETGDVAPDHPAHATAQVPHPVTVPDRTPMQRP